MSQARLCTSLCICVSSPVIVVVVAVAVGIVTIFAVVVADIFIVEQLMLTSQNLHIWKCQWVENCKGVAEHGKETNTHFFFFQGSG